MLAPLQQATALCDSRVMMINTSIIGYSSNTVSGMRRGMHEAGAIHPGNR